MKAGIHPKQNIVSYTCNSCKTTYRAYSTSTDDVRVEVCSHCHPFYTGEQGVVVDTYNRVDKFLKAQQAADSDTLVKKRKKAASRRAKINEVKASTKLTLKDMLKQSK